MVLLAMVALLGPLITLWLLLRWLLRRLGFVPGGRPQRKAGCRLDSTPHGPPFAPRGARHLLRTARRARPLPLPTQARALGHARARTSRLHGSR
jgi:hypothetical protein